MVFGPLIRNGQAGPAGSDHDGPGSLVGRLSSAMRVPGTRSVRLKWTRWASSNRARDDLILRRAQPASVGRTCGGSATLRNVDSEQDPGCAAEVRIRP